MNTSLIYAPLSPAALTARWRELLAQPGLPERYEIDEFGELVEMNPPKTAHQRIVSCVACLAAGMDDYVTKPIRVDMLVAALKRVRPHPGSAD